ncbi:hypothetical protein TV39_00595 [Arthrobacter sp. SPG23]|uniref:DUF3592 domain-containing protein n=1 Tax=Arthrobacter sp. SPG23 TaxID=1610703 RepID=UPI0005B81BEC|nr:DUF3592 domain-containing protein [Arthrobacter sp. SPG23]KIS29293.1 hypothetical protein TV39_00595 [Arthrobacter sp. SPG23]
MKTVLYIIWALFVVAAAVSITAAMRKAKRQEKLAAQWPRVQATVTGSTAGWSSAVGSSGSRHRLYRPTYRFADPRGTMYFGESDVPFRSEPVPGSTVEVAYNPADPNQSIHQASKEKAGMGCMIAFIAVFVVAAFWFIGIFPVS